MRTFAFATAAVLVFAQLLPEALDQIGIVALPVFAAALLLPSSLERLAHAGHQRHGQTHHPGEHADDHAPGLELGYLGLVLHNFGDGLGIGTFGGPLRSSDLQLEIALSIAAHTIPVTALFVVAFASQRGVHSALVRAVGLGVAIAAGVLFASVVPAQAVEPFEPWLAAGVAGLLLHVIAHDWPVQRLRSRRERTLDLIAIAAGLAMILLAGGHDPGLEHPGERGRLAGTLLGLALETGPLLLVGLAAAAVLRALRVDPLALRDRGRIRPDERAAPSGGTASSYGAVRQAWRGAVLALRMPATPSRAAAIATLLGDETSAASSLAIAFLLAAPALGMEILALSAGFLGFKFAAGRLLGALLVAIGATALVTGFARPRTGSRSGAPIAGRATSLDSAREGASAADVEGRSDGAWLRLRGHLDDLLFESGAWMILGLIAASYAEIALPEGALAGFARGGLDVLLVSVVALPGVRYPAALVPLAAVLIGKGLSPGAALAGLLITSASSSAGRAFLRRSVGTRGTSIALAGLLAIAWLLGLVLNASKVTPDIGSVARDGGHGAAAWAALALLGLLLVRTIWQSGLRAWLGALSASDDHSNARHSRHDEAAAARAYAELSRERLG